MAFPLLALILGILASPCLDSRYVWLTLPLAILISFAKPRCALLAVALFGAGIASLTPQPPPDEPDATATRITGRLTRPPEWHGLGAYLDLQLQTLDGKEIHGGVRLTEFLDDPIQRQLFEALELGSGDLLEIVVKLHRPTVYRDPGVFDYRRHLERQGIYWTGNIRSPRLITVLKHGWHEPDRIKRWIEKRLEAPFENQPQIQGLVLGMVLGRKYGLDAEVERQFQAGGLYHLVVVSGFNLAVIAGAALWIARFIPWKRSARLLFVLTCALAYAAMVEGQAPVYRATIAITFLVVGRLLDRGYSVLNATAAAAFFLLIYDPSAVEDSSFQMTFAAVLAVAGIGIPSSQWLLGWLREGLKDFDDTAKDGQLSLRASDWRVSRRVWCERHRLPSWIVTAPWKCILFVGEALIVSLAVEVIFTFFMVESFHRFSPISPLINVPAGLITAAVTPLALALIFVPDFLWPVATLLSWVISSLLGLLLKILDFALQIPGASLRVPSPPILLWLMYAAVAGCLILGIHKRWIGVAISTAAAICGLQAVIVFADFSPPAPKDVTLTFLDVGQGDSILIEFQSGYRMLIDGGGVSTGRFLDLRDESTFSIGENVVSPYLYSRGIRRLDAVVLTHAHNDHMDGLFNVIENFRVGEFWLGKNPMTARYRQLIERIQSKQIPIRWVSAGQTIGTLTVLHPPADWIPKRNALNNDSVVMLLKANAATALLTGDIETNVTVPEHVTVLKVPHHGSKGVRVRPRADVRVISVGANNPFGHPHESALPALRTDRLGAVTVVLGNSTKVALTQSRCSCKLTFLFSH